MSWEVLLPESPQHLRQGTWGELRKATPWGPCFHPGFPAPPGCGCPPGPSSVPVYLQELPCPVLPVPRPPHIFPAASQCSPDRPPEALCKGRCPATDGAGGGSMCGGPDCFEPPGPAWLGGVGAQTRGRLRALPSLQRTLSSEYCGVIRAMWGCDQGHDYTMDADSSCGALLLDSALGVKWTWDKDSAPRLPQHRGFNPTGAAPQSSQGRAAAAGAETETLPSMDTSRLPSDGDPVGPGPGPPSQPSLPPGGAPGQLGEKQVPSPASDDRRFPE